MLNHGGSGVENGAAESKAKQITRIVCVCARG